MKTGPVLKSWLALLLLATLCCVKSSPVPHVAFSEFVNAKDLDGRNMRVAGSFDLKSICLNFKPHYKPTGDVCKAYFSENLGVNPPAREVSLKVCQNGISTNCIDPLPENAPPEVIVIRNSAGEKLELWGRAEIEVRLSSADTLTGVEVIKIDGAK